jgi:hypothetical protein
MPPTGSKCPAFVGGAEWIKEQLTFCTSSMEVLNLYVFRDTGLPVQLLIHYVLDYVHAVLSIIAVIDTIDRKISESIFCSNAHEKLSFATARGNGE